MNKSIAILYFIFLFFSTEAMEEKSNGQDTQSNSTQQPIRTLRWINNFSPREKQLYRTRKAQAAQHGEKYKPFF